MEESALNKKERGHKSGPASGSYTEKIFLLSDRTFWEHLLFISGLFYDKNKLILSLLNHFSLRPLTSYIFLVPHVVSLVHLRRELRVNIYFYLVSRVDTSPTSKKKKKKVDLCKCGNTFFQEIWVYGWIHITVGHFINPHHHCYCNICLTVAVFKVYSQAHFARPCEWAVLHLNYVIWKSESNLVLKSII